MNDEISLALAQATDSAKAAAREYDVEHDAGATIGEVAGAIRSLARALELLGPMAAGARPKAGGASLMDGTPKPAGTSNPPP